MIQSNEGSGYGAGGGPVLLEAEPVGPASTKARREDGKTTPGAAELIRALIGDIRLWFRQEADLIKTEAAEKTKMAGKSVAAIAGGALAAYAGIVILLLAVAGLIGAGLVALGMNELLASFVSALVVGGAVIGIGAAVIKAGLDKLSPDSLSPDRTKETLQDAGRIAKRDTTSNTH